MSYRLLEQFRKLFDGVLYRHRDPTHGDRIAQYFPEDLVALGRSKSLLARIASGERVVNAQNVRTGIKARRGDGSFGEVVPGAPVVRGSGLNVARGAVATIEIGTEVKILAKAMIKQIDRVQGDLQKQVAQFKRGGDQPICLAIVGINHADYCASYEGERVTLTDGRRHKHPKDEAADAEQRIIADVRPHYDELLLLRYKATNVAPYPFQWVEKRDTEMEYAAILTRVSRQYDQRF